MLKSMTFKQTSKMVSNAILLESCKIPLTAPGIIRTPTNHRPADEIDSKAVIGVLLGTL